MVTYRSTAADSGSSSAIINCQSPFIVNSWRFDCFQSLFCRLNWRITGCFGNCWGLCCWRVFDRFVATGLGFGSLEACLGKGLGGLACWKWIVCFDRFCSSWEAVCHRGLQRSGFCYLDALLDWGCLGSLGFESTLSTRRLYIAFCYCCFHVELRGRHVLHCPAKCESRQPSIPGPWRASSSGSLFQHQSLLLSHSSSSAEHRPRYRRRCTRWAARYRSLALAHPLVLQSAGCFLWYLPNGPSSPTSFACCSHSEYCWSSPFGPVLHLLLLRSLAFASGCSSARCPHWSAALSCLHSSTSALRSCISTGPGSSSRWLSGVDFTGHKRYWQCPSLRISDLFVSNYSNSKYLHFMNCLSNYSTAFGEIDDAQALEREGHWLLEIGFHLSVGIQRHLKEAADGSELGDLQVSTLSLGSGSRTGLDWRAAGLDWPCSKRALPVAGSALCCFSPGHSSAARAAAAVVSWGHSLLKAVLQRAHPGPVHLLHTESACDLPAPRCGWGQPGRLRWRQTAAFGSQTSALPPFHAPCSRPSPPHSVLWDSASHCLTWITDWLTFCLINSNCFMILGKL